MTPKNYLETIAEDLADLTREEKLLTLRDYGEQLPPMDDTLKTEENMVPGCASATYIVCHHNPDGTLHFIGDSQSFISKGYIYVLTHAFNGCTPQELANSQDYVQAFAEKTGVRLSMIASRANVFERIYHFMQMKALAQ